MRKFTFLPLFIALIFAYSMQSFGQTTLYESGFDEMTVGDYLAETDDTGFWTTWSNAPGGVEDAQITDAQSSSPSNSVEVQGTSTDLLFLMGNKTSGKYQFDVKYYIEPGFGGYINIQHFEVPGTEWAFETFFGATEQGYITAGGVDTGFDFNAGEWLDLSFVIDLDGDLAQFFLNGDLVHEWPFHYQASGESGTLQLGAADIFAGAPTGETPHYYFDDVTFTEIVAGTQVPIIDIDLTPVVQVMEVGETYLIERELGNLGEEDLNYEVVPTYDFDTKGYQSNSAYNYPDYPKSLTRELKALHSSTPTPQDNQGERDEVLRYDDGTNNTAIGIDADQVWRVAAMFPYEMVQPFIGMEISSVEVYINNLSLSHTLQIYGMGSILTPGPGSLIYDQDFTPNAESWNTIVLDAPVPISGEDIWVGYMIDKPADAYTAGCDFGPANPNGDWISHGEVLGWGHLADNPELNFNWNIAATLTGEPAIQWITVSPDGGTLAQDETVTLEINLDATSLAPDQSYLGKVKIRSNDPENEIVTLAINMVVIVGVDEQETGKYLMVYPNPANDMLRISNLNGEITHIRLTNTVGQVVIDQAVNAPNVKVDVSQLPKGVYMATVETPDGTATQKVIVE